MSIDIIRIIQFLGLYLAPPRCPPIEKSLPQPVYHQVWPLSRPDGLEVKGAFQNVMHSTYDASPLKFRLCSCLAFHAAFVI